MKKVKRFMGKFGVLSLSTLLLIVNLTGTALFYGQFSESSQIKEASRFNPASGYTSNSSTQGSSPVDASITKEIRLLPLGSTFGIKLYTDGVIVTALADIHTSAGSVCPAKDAGLQVGDYITMVNQEKVENNAHFTALLSKSLSVAPGSSLTLRIRRADTEFETTLTPALDKNLYRCGMWIRDSAAGIGTLTFAEPTTQDFAGLGHGICDVDTKELMSLKNGEPAPITVCGIDQGQKNNPGKINGYFADDTALGSLYDNNETGIYGKLSTLPPGETVLLATKEEVATGPAEILTTIDNQGPQRFTVQIESLATDKNKLIKNFVVKITDERLLAATGGIVQGMSGTPILQNNKLIGAITHVFLDDPTMGFGIFAETMYKNLHKAR